MVACFTMVMVLEGRDGRDGRRRLCETRWRVSNDGWRVVSACGAAEDGGCRGR